MTGGGLYLEVGSAQAATEQHATVMRMEIQQQRSVRMGGDHVSLQQESAGVTHNTAYVHTVKTLSVIVAMAEVDRHTRHRFAAPVATVQLANSQVVKIHKIAKQGERSQKRLLKGSKESSSCSDLDKQSITWWLSASSA